MRGSPLWGTTRIRLAGVFIAVNLVALTAWVLMAMLTFWGGNDNTMRYFQWAICILSLASLVSAQQDQPQGQSELQQQPPSKATDSQSKEQPKPVVTGPAVDSAKVKGSTFDSAYFKFTYELPKDWKTLDDAVRVGENQRFLEQERVRAVARLPVPKKKTVSAKTPATNPVLATVRTPTVERYSLMVASPKGVQSLESSVLPRINIWAHARVGSDDISDHARYLVATKRAQILGEPQEVKRDAHTFVRVDILAPTGEYHSQFVTIVGAYIVGFDFWATTQKELSSLADTTQSIKFH